MKVLHFSQFLFDGFVLLVLTFKLSHKNCCSYLRCCDRERELGSVVPFKCKLLKFPVKRKIFIYLLIRWNYWRNQMDYFYRAEIFKSLNIQITQPEVWFWTCGTWFKGIANLAFTASKWSRRAIKLLTCSSNRTFSERSWCKHDSNDATKQGSKSH